MAKPRIFLSSTFYDLKHIRADIISFIENLGYSAIKHETGDIPFGKKEALEEYCYKEIKNIDILISIIGGKFGSESKSSEYSISQLELKEAQRENKQVYIFIESNVLSEYETYLVNKDNVDVRYKYADDVRIYNFIEEIKGLSSNNNIKGFDSVSDITRYLKEQFAGLFQKYLEDQSRIHEVRLIDKLESTANTLNKLVSYLSDENKEKEDEVNRILMTNHPLIDKIKEYLGIKYNIYIEGFNDLNQLLRARGYDDGFKLGGEYIWYRVYNNKKYALSISTEIFNETGKLKFIGKNEWKDDITNFQVVDIGFEKDDLPF